MSRLTNLDCFTGGDFEEYAEHLQFYFLASDMGKLGSLPSPAEKHAADRKKAAVLISLLSGTVYSTLKSLCLPNTPATRGFDELITLVNDYYKPEVSSVTATYLFNQCRQESEESVKDFFSQLRDVTHTNFRSLGGIDFTITSNRVKVQMQSSITTS